MYVNFKYKTPHVRNVKAGVLQQPTHSKSGDRNRDARDANDSELRQRAAFFFVFSFSSPLCRYTAHLANILAPDNV